MILPALTATTSDVQFVDAGASLVVAVISAIVAVIGAMVAWVKEASVVALKGTIDQALENRKAELAAGLEARKTELALGLETKLGQVKAEIERGLASHEAALRVASERQLEVFRLASTSSADAARMLLLWLDALHDFSHETFGSLEAYDNNIDTLLTLQRDADKSGLFLPPVLDDAFLKAREALRAATKAVSRDALANKMPHGGSEGTINAHYRGVESAEAAVGAFMGELRQWKASEWPSTREPRVTES